MKFLLLFLFLVSPLLAQPAKILSSLLDPAKIATLKGERPVNTRFYKVLYWVEIAEREGAEVSAVIDEAQKLAAYGGTPRAKMDKEAIIWSWKKLETWGCFGAEGMEELRRGGSPTIKNGFLAGEEMALDHVLPVALVPELRSAFFNLEAITAKKNLRKGANVGEREKKFARRLFEVALP